MSESGQRLWDQPVVKLVKLVLPWLVLLVVLVKVSGIYSDYQKASSAAEKKAAEATAALSADLKGAKKPPGTTKSAGKKVKVLIEGLNLRARPLASSDVVKVLAEGDILSLLKQEGNWLQAKASDGKTGWLSNNDKYVSIQK